MRNFFLASVCLAALWVPIGAGAAETGGCESFTWPIATDLQWLKSGDSEALASGAKLVAPPEKAIALALQPMSKVSFPVAPTSRSTSDAAEAFGGFIDIEGVPAAGLYQVTIATSGWVDIVQNGKTLKPTAHTGKSDCEGARKSLRFAIGSGPFSVELSNIKKETIKFSIRRAE